MTRSAFWLHFIIIHLYRHTLGQELQLQYFGCFKGNGSSEIVRISLSYPERLTISECINKCKDETFVGLHNGNRCFCSEYFGQQVPDSQCRAKCSGNIEQNCGGYLYNSAPIYSVYAACPVGYFGPQCKRRCNCKQEYPCNRKTGSCPTGCAPFWNGSSCDKNTVDFNDQYIGCFRDNTTSPAMNQKNPSGNTGLMHPTNNNIENCIEICSSFNYTYAGMQYGYDCNCGDQYDRYGTYLHEYCNYPCPGNQSQKCGGFLANSVYHVCPSGYYGHRCVNRCNCASGSRCSSESCFNGGCKPGYMGDTCNIRDCSVSNGGCGPLEYCTVIDLGYTFSTVCRCKFGYLRLGSDCVQVHTRYIGCFEGDTRSTSYSVLSSNDHLTVELCIVWCHQLTRQFSMLKAGKTCVCRNNLMRLKMRPDNKSQIPCAGSRNQYCGMEDNQDNGYAVYAARYRGMTWCTDDKRCAVNGFCAEINLNFIKVKRCRCKKGFNQNYPWNNCTDVDECADSDTVCPMAFNCTNTIGSYSCSYCPNGSAIENGSCVFSLSTHDVSENPHRADSDRSTAVIVGGIFGVLIILSLVVVGLIICFILKNKEIPLKRNNVSDSHTAEINTTASDFNHEEDTAIVHFPMNALCPTDTEITSKIKTKEFPAYLRLKLANRGALEQEFESVPWFDETKSFSAGQKQKDKNRFKNILPYDYNRVTLPTKKNVDGDDYINASFIISYSKEEKQIASQGPTQATLKDFWRMIDVYDVRGIVMISNLIEDGKKKCECYWPESEEKLEIEDMTITLSLTEHWPNWIIRQIQLQKEGETRTIKQYHFTMWPDHGVPIDIKGFLDFRRNVRNSLPLDKYTVVHCSAGIGRTGSFIAINHLLEQAESEGSVDVLACLRNLRNQRPYMVQTSEQYQFIHCALAIEFQVGKTSILVEHFDDYYKALLIKDSELGKSRLESQYQVLEEQLIQQTDRKTIIRDSMSTPRNQGDSGVLPKSRNTFASSKTSMVFVQDWKRCNAYIVSEYPQEDSRSYFRTICNDYDSNFIIYIENDRNSESLFPNHNQAVSFGNWRIQCHSRSKEFYGYNNKMSLTYISELEYANAMSSTAKELTLLQLRTNSNGSLSLLHEVIFSIYSVIKTLGPGNGTEPIPVVIINGSDCSLGGLLVAAFNAFDMLSERKEVDLYQIVSEIKRARSPLVLSLETYGELHDVVNQRIAGRSANLVYGNL